MFLIFFQNKYYQKRIQIHSKNSYFPCFYSTKMRSSTHMYPLQYLLLTSSHLTSSSTPHFLTNSITSSLTYPFSLYCYFIPDFLTISSLFLFPFPNRLNLFSLIFPITFALLLNSFFYIHLSLPSLYSHLLEPHQTQRFFVLYPFRKLVLYQRNKIQIAAR